MTELAGWENFYVIVGSSAGALIGLQFVVITLIAARPIVTGQEQAGDAFATPTIVHFGTVLLLSAIVSAPWHGVTGAAILWGLTGVTGIVYEIIVVRRMRKQSVYTPQFEDWLFHVLLPFAAYATLLDRRARLVPVHEAPCLALGQRRCCYCSSAFTTPGMVLPTTSFLLISGEEKTLSGLADKSGNLGHTTQCLEEKQAKTARMESNRIN
jgi:hypothetical protein